MQFRKLVAMAVGAWLVAGCGGEMEEVDLGTQQNELAAVWATTANRSVLSNMCWQSSYALWDGCSGKKGGKDLSTWFSKTSMMIGTIKGTKVSNGQCAAFVINVGPDANMYASNWRKGLNVMANPIAVGVAVGTFDANGNYDSGHSGIFAGKKADGTGFYIWDANWSGNGAVKYHTINTGGSGVSNANNYYVVMN